MEEIGREEVETAMHKMKKGKATGADEVWLKMLEMAGDVGVKWTGRLLNVCMQEGRIPKEWMMGLIVPIWKRKGDVHDPGKYRGITLLSQVLKLLERVLDARIRRRVEGDFGEEQQGFRKGRGTADGMYVLRQMVEKRLEGTGQYGSGVRRPRESFCHSTQRDGDGVTTVDGSTRSGSEDGGGHIREYNSKSCGGRRSFGGVRGQDWAEAGQRAEPVTVHSSTGPHQ